MKTFKTVKLKGVKKPVEVNEDGTVIIHNGREVSQHTLVTSKNSKGYKAVSIESKSFYVHRIVAEAYIVNTSPVSHRFVLHKDGDITNNHYTNLMWGTNKDLYEKNREKISSKGKLYRGTSSIPYEEAVKIAERLDNGEYAKDICKEYGVSEMSIARIRKRYCKKTSASPRYDDTIKATVYKLANKYPVADVAKITGLPYHTVYRWLKQREEKQSKPKFYY